MMRRKFGIFVLLCVIGVGCQTGVNNIPGTPGGTPSAFDAQWLAQLDNDGVEDCFTITNGAVSATSANCTTALLIIQSLPLQQVGDDFSLVWATRLVVGANVTDTQFSFDGVIQPDGTIVGTLRSISSVNDQLGPLSTTNITMRRAPVATP
jgi:hypothetical protein